MKEQDLNRYCGFLTVTVDWQEGEPALTFRFYGVDSDVLTVNNFMTKIGHTSKRVVTIKVLLEN